MKLLEMEVKKMGMQLFLGSADKGVGIGPVAETLRVMVERLSKQ